MCERHFTINEAGYYVANNLQYGFDALHTFFKVMMLSYREDMFVVITKTKKSDVVFREGVFSFIF